MPVHNADIARCFDEIADLLELRGENPFRVRAYRNAARVIGELSLDLAEILGKGGELPRIPGVGEDLAGKIREIAAGGSCRLLEELRAKFPPGITELLTLPAPMAHGLDPQRLARQIAEIDRLNAEGLGITVLKGIEVDILEDGSLDLPDSILARLDLVVGAIHSRLNLPRACQTQRILAAMDNPYFTILAHPTGRLLEAREPYELDMPAVLRKAKARGIAVELNAHPDRLDLTDMHCRMAKEEGALVVISSDAHSTDGFDVLRYGVGQARRGWLARTDVLNARPLAELRLHGVCA